MAKRKPTPWDDLKLADVGESFGVHHDIFGHRLEINPNMIAAIATMHMDTMLDDQFDGQEESIDKDNGSHDRDTSSEI